MESYQKQTTWEKDRFLKRQTKLKALILFLLIILFSKNLIGADLNFKVQEYIKNLNFFSSKFIQSNSGSINEGYLYIQNGKIRLDYFNPDRTIKIGQKKGVYINHELKEEEFFSVDQNIIGVFYKIFQNYDFFSDVKLKENKGEIIFEKTIMIDSKKIGLKVFFENNPLLLRKIITKTDDEILSLSFNEHSHNNVFEKDFFSFVPIYLD